MTYSKYKVKSEHEGHPDCNRAIKSWIFITHSFAFFGEHFTFIVDCYFALTICIYLVCLNINVKVINENQDSVQEHNPIDDDTTEMVRKWIWLLINFINVGHFQHISEFW